MLDLFSIPIPDASATSRGAVTTGTQTLAGAKTLSGQTVIGTAASSQVHTINGLVNHGEAVQNGRIYADEHTAVAGSGGTTSFSIGKGAGFLVVRVQDAANSDRYSNAIYFYSMTGTASLTVTQIGSTVSGSSGAMSFALSNSGTNMVVTNNASQSANAFVSFHGTV